MDICQCICNPLFRLLYMLQNQARYCGRSDCLRDLPQPPASDFDGWEFIVGGWIILITLLYTFRPTSFPSLQSPTTSINTVPDSSAAEKHRNNDRHNHDQGPPPSSS